MLAAYARAKVADFKTFEPDLAAGDHQYTLDITYDVERNDGQMFAVLFTEFADTGGAHPNTDFSAFNFLLPSGEQVFLPEIVDGARGMKRVSDLAIAQHIKTIGTGEDSMSSKEDIVSGAAPDALSPEGLALAAQGAAHPFPPYQVAAYAAGPQGGLDPADRSQGLYPRRLACAAAFVRLQEGGDAGGTRLCADLALSRLDRDAADVYRQKQRYADANTKAALCSRISAPGSPCAARPAPAAMSCPA